MEPIKIRSDIPLESSGWGKLRNLRAAIKSMKPRRDSFEWPNNRLPYVAAKALGIKIRVEKIDGGGYRVWRKTIRFTVKP